MSGSSFVIVLTPGALHAAVVRAGRIADARHVPLEPSEWERAWEEGLRPLDAALAGAVEELNGAGMPASVFHHGPTVVAEVFSCPSRGVDARGAAALALADQVNFELGEHPHGAHTLARDRSGSPVQAHTLIAADHEGSAQQVCAWLERAGLKVRLAAPVDAPMLAEIVHRTMALDGERMWVVLRIGEHRATLAAGGGGRLRLARHVELGVDTLVDVLTRPIHAGGAGDSSEIALSRAEARELLLSAGVPEPGDTVDAERGLRGSDLLPLLQPLLQRCLVEIRQSLRFGLDEEERGQARLIVLGPGTAVPRLAEVLATQANLPLEARKEPEQAAGLAAATGPGSDLATVVRWVDSCVGLLPRAQTAAMTMVQVRRALWAGAGLALVALGVDAALLYDAASRTAGQLAAMRPTLAPARELLAERDRIRTDAESVAVLERGVQAAMGQPPSWGAWLLELAALTPERIHVASIATGAGAGADSVDLRGYLETREDADGVQDLTEYVRTLQRSPLVRSVSLGMTQRTTLDGAEALQFTIAVRLVGLPVPALASADEGGAP